MQQQISFDLGTLKLISDNISSKGAEHRVLKLARINFFYVIATLYLAYPKIKIENKNKCTDLLMFC